jgi:toxin FitB
VTLGESTQSATLRARGPRNKAKLAQWLHAKPVLPHSQDVARMWGEISAHAIQRGRPRPANDTWIAARCLVYELPLATLNVKDFADYAEHEGLSLIAL